MKKLMLLVLLAACESGRTIPTKAAPQGERIRCVGVTGKGKRAGIDYDFSARNIVVGIVFFQIIAPPVVVLVRETYCPTADTTR